MNTLPVFLLADSDEARRRARCAALAGEDVAIKEASTGRKALELAGAGQDANLAPDAVLLELDLADQDGGPEDGLDIYRRLKANAVFTAPVILSIPASAPEAQRAAALAEGAEAYVLEPVGPELFAATVRSMLRLGRAERERALLTARLRAAQAETEQVAAQLCHDIEEPLRAVSTFVQLVEERQGLTEPERGYLAHVLAAGARARSVLRGFLSYAQAGHGRRARFGRVDLGSPAAAAVQALRKRVDQTQTVITVEGPWPTVWGDFGQLQQVFEHVIRNAIDYHPAGSAPVIAIKAAQGPGQEWTIAISDNGPGIGADFQSAIFLPFKRLHGREIPGAGLGLAISKKIVETHGGRIWVESQAGAGACFRFTIRALESEHSASEQAMGGHAAG